ncbi:hypothetical protein Tco_0003734 [Tanacetum coccineum]
MEDHLAPTQPTQVNKVSSPCKTFSGPHDTQYCMKNPEQAFVDYTSSRINEVEGKRFTPNQGPRNFNESTNTWKEKPNFNWAYTQTFTSPQGGSVSIHSSSYQMKLEKALLDFDSNHEKRLSYLKTQLEQQQDDMIGKINLLWKTVSEKLNNVSTPKNVRNSIAPKSIAAISHAERKELRRKESKAHQNYSPKLSLSRIHKRIKQKSNSSKTRSFCQFNHDVEVEEVIEEEESEFETDEEVEEILKEEKDDEDSKKFNSFPTIEELTHHERLLKKSSYLCGNNRSPIHLGEMVFGRPFIEETGLVYNKEEGSIMFKQEDEKIAFKMPHTMKVIFDEEKLGIFIGSYMDDSQGRNDLTSYRMFLLHY